MEFKAIVLCFAFFVVAASGASVCKCAEEEKKETKSKYTVEIDNGKKKVDETIEIDTDKETETFHVPDNGDTSKSSPGEVKTIFDFKKNMAMHRLSNQKACFLMNSTDNLPKPADLKKLMDIKDGQGSSNAKSTSSSKYVVTGTLDDRTILSDEMADLCAKFPIYLIEKEHLQVAVEKERQKRGCYWIRICYLYCCYYYRCYWWLRC